ncbi:MAG: rhodanese-like domain-containing protein [Hyphomicrobiaceae bacterium]
MTTAKHDLALSLVPLAAMIVGVVVPSAAAEPDTGLGKLEAEVARDYPAVPHVTPAEFASRLPMPDDLLLLDARAPTEVGVSRLPGAEQVDPEISVEDFIARFGDRAKGRDVVIYCSVGVRSSKLATRVREAMLARGARRVGNLRGGIFALHNNNQPLIDDLGQTSWVHPYSWWWSRYLERRELTRYEPRRPGEAGRN